MKFLSKLFPSRKNREGDFFVFLRDVTGVKPKDTSYYKLAFKQNANSNEFSENGVPQNNERLEFLGDAILGAVIADYLYQKYPEKDEGFLTSMRSKIVSRSNLNMLAKELGIVEVVKNSLGKYKPSKSVGGDTLEALIGAIYLDRGIIEAQRFVYSRIIKEHIYLDELEQHIISYKGLFIEWAQKERKQFEFTLLNQWGKQHNRTFKMGLMIDDALVATGKGSSKKRAEENAAKIAYLELSISQ